MTDSFTPGVKIRNLDETYCFSECNDPAILEPDWEQKSDDNLSDGSDNNEIVEENLDETDKSLVEIPPRIVEKRIDLKDFYQPYWEQTESISLTEEQTVREIHWLLSGAKNLILFNLQDNKFIVNPCVTRAGSLCQKTLGEGLIKIGKSGDCVRNILKFRDSRSNLKPIQACQSWLGTYLQKFWTNLQIFLHCESIFRFINEIERNLNELLLISTTIESIFRSESSDYFTVKQLLTDVYLSARDVSRLGSSNDASILFDLFITVIKPLIKFLDQLIDWRLSSIDWKNFTGQNMSNVVELFPLECSLFVDVSVKFSCAVKSAEILRKLNFPKDLIPRGSIFGDLNECLASLSTSTPAIVTFSNRFREIFDENYLKINRGLMLIINETLGFEIMLKEIKFVVTLICLDTFCCEFLEAQDRSNSTRFRQSDVVYLENVFHSCVQKCSGSTTSMDRWNISFGIDTAGSQSIDRLEFRVNLPWPLEQIVTSSHQNSYNKIFRFLMQIFECRWRLASLEFKKINCTVDLNVTHKMMLLRFRLLVVLSSLSSCLISQVSENFALNKIIRSKSIEECVESHQNLVDDLMKMAFLDKTSEILLRAILKLLETTKKLTKIWTGETKLSDVDSLSGEVENCLNFINYLFNKTISRNETAERLQIYLAL